jgi:hypothetical protein
MATSRAVSVFTARLYLSLLSCGGCVQVTAVGEVMLEVGAPQGWGPSRLTSQQLQQVLAALQQAAKKGGADATVLRQGSTEMAAEGEHVWQLACLSRVRTCTQLPCTAGVCLQKQSLCAEPVMSVCTSIWPAAPAAELDDPVKHRSSSIQLAVFCRWRGVCVHG